jgi:hypothetical protein
MPRVRNVVTGLTWSVPAGHFSLADSEYEVLPEAPPEPALVAQEAPKARARPKKE